MIAKISGNEEVWCRYKVYKRTTQKEIRRPHASFFRHALTNSLEENNLKPFYQYIKAKRLDSGIPPIKQGDEYISNSSMKAEVFKSLFQSVFTHHKIDTLHVISKPQLPRIQPLHITLQGIENLLKRKESCRPRPYPEPRAEGTLQIYHCLGN